MATSYEVCYDVFLDNINDVEILYPVGDETELEHTERVHAVCLAMFKRAVGKYFFCQTSLEKNDTTETFTNTLRQVEIEIIGLMMLREYYRKQLNFLASLKQSFSDKDWKSSNPATQMTEYRQLMKDTKTEINELIKNNSYVDNSGDLQGWWA